MRFGIFSNGQRLTNTVNSFDDDLHEIVVAEEVGFEECWMSEHTGHTWLPQALPAPELLMAKASALTEKIRFGAAVKRIALYPPQMTAIEGAVTDHLTHGRYNFGFGVGPPVTNYGHWGIDKADAEARTLEAFDLIMKCWYEPEPFDFQGRFFSGRDIAIYPKIRQSKIPIAVASGRREFLDLAARHDGRVLTTWSFSTQMIAKLGASFDEVCETYGGPRRHDLVASRVVYVADTDEKAWSHIERDFDDLLEFSAKNIEPATAVIAKDAAAGKPIATFRSMMEGGNIIAGSPATVIDGIQRFHDDVGGFGTMLIVAGRDFGTVEQRDDSYRLLAEAVVPKFAGLTEADGDYAANDQGMLSSSQGARLLAGSLDARSQGARAG